MDADDEVAFAGDGQGVANGDVQVRIPSASGRSVGSLRVISPSVMRLAASLAA